MKKPIKYVLPIKLSTTRSKRRRMRRRAAYSLHIRMLRRTAEKAAGDLVMKILSGQPLNEIDGALIAALINPLGVRVTIHD